MARPTAKTVSEYLDGLDPDRRDLVEAVCKAIRANVPPGIEEGIQNGTIAWYVPHAIHPDGYHCDPHQPVPFAAVASRKAGVSIYLFFLYVDPDRVERFVRKWKATGKRLDMGKSCIRVKNLEGLAAGVLGDAVRGTTVEDFLARYTGQLAATKAKSSER